MKIQVVAGAQYGSEAKGHVTHRLVREASLGGFNTVNVRVGGPNAGHTVYAKSGEKFAFRQLPVGAIEEDVLPIIAQGSEIDLPVLMSEIRLRNVLREARGLDLLPVYVDEEATMLDPVHKEAEAAKSLVSKIGSTGKGIGAARSDRLMRTARRLVDDRNAMDTLESAGCVVTNTATILRGLNRHSIAVIEGTQGYGLGLHAGHYPQCTAGDCTATDFLAQAGLPPFGHDVEPWIVARMFPIRVAGNSGPLFGETTWTELGLPPEYTTVTKKERRVGLWDDGLFARALEANGGGDVVKVALTMIDQRWPLAADVEYANELTSEVTSWVANLESRHDCVVTLLTTGPRSAVWL